MATRKNKTAVALAIEPPAGHAPLSPSGSARWLTCPGSVSLCASRPKRREDKTGYAARGTAIHTLAEMILRGADGAELLGTKIDAFKVDQDMLDIAYEYTELVWSIMGDKLFEERASLAEIIPDCWGTSDAVVMQPRKLFIIDLKTGAGVPVYSEDNTQLMIYALGVFLKYDWLYDFQEIELIISQPPLNNTSRWVMSRADLMDFAEVLKAAYQRIKNEPTVYVPSEDACRWCEAKPICPAMQSLAMEAACTDFAEVKADPDQLSFWLKKLPIINAFSKAVESEAKDILLDGGKVEGFKVVKGRSSRHWTNDDEVGELLIGKGFARSLLCTVPTWLSVAQMEKLLKGREVLAEIAEFVVSVPGQPTITHDGDKRPALEKIDTAKNDFASD